MNTSLASVLVLSEDSARDSGDTLAAILKRIIGDIEPSCQVHRIDFEPLQNPQARRAMRANFWRSSELQDQAGIELLRRTIATKLLETPPGFVVFHSDGDTPWSRREDCSIPRLFEERIRAQVRRLVEPEAQRRGLSCEEVLSRLFLWIPHYSIESWLYQNTMIARQLCQKHYLGRDLELFTAWEADRRQLDEVIKPKQATCLQSRHNLELAQGQYPVAAVYGESPSFTAAVDLVMACVELITRLKPSWAQPSG